MQAITVRCPGCGASVSVDGDYTKKYFCCYCGTGFFLRNPGVNMPITDALVPPVQRTVAPNPHPPNPHPPNPHPPSPYPPNPHPPNPYPPSSYPPQSDMDISFNRAGTPNGQTGNIATPQKRLAIIVLVIIAVGAVLVFFAFRASSGVTGSLHTMSGTGDSSSVSAQVDGALVGTWYWLGSPYYVLEANGRGTMMGSNIRWSTTDGVLYICNTPNMCGNNCPLPTAWNYTIEGNQLRLESRITPDLSFTYTRGAPDEQDEVANNDDPGPSHGYEEPPENPFASYAVDFVFEMHPFRVTINEIFIVTDARSAPDEGNKYVGISFIFENISNESQRISWSQASVYVDGFLTNYSFAASFAIERSMGSNSFSNSISAGRSVRNHYAIEVPIGTTELEIEFNCGAFPASDRHVEIVRLSIPQQ